MREQQTFLQLGVGIEQFKILEPAIGKGTYGEVKMVERDNKRYAMKTIVKEDVIRVCLVSTLNLMYSIVRQT